MEKNADDDEKTLAALEQIKAILVEYDLWGAVSVTSDKRTHWLYHFAPSWSCMALDPATGAVRIRAKRADFSTPEGQHHVVEQTAGAVFNTRDYAAMLFSHMDIVAKKLEGEMQIEHHPFSDVRVRREP